MQTYRFNLEDHHFIADRGVYECADEDDAKLMTHEIADTLIQRQPELLHGGHAIVVRDVHNRQVYRADMDRRSISERRN